MSQQDDINAKMRSILVDWLVEVHHKFKLQTLTLWLCINILDRYLEATQIRRTKLQLVGVTALLIASKYEDVYAPEVKDCVYITDYAYDRDEILQMESSILTVLNYQVFVPTGYHFLVRYMNAIGVPERIRHLASYYAERNLQEYDTLREKPHIFAASALFAALMQSRPNDSRGRPIPAWGKSLQDETGLQEHQLTRCARLIVQHVSEEPETASRRRLIAAKKKYSSDKFMNVAALSLPMM
jgi:G2/mitotic-specific cyclin-B, other